MLIKPEYKAGHRSLQQNRVSLPSASLPKSSAKPTISNGSSDLLIASDDDDNQVLSFSCGKSIRRYPACTADHNHLVTMDCPASTCLTTADPFLTFGKDMAFLAEHTVCRRRPLSYRVPSNAVISFPGYYRSFLWTNVAGLANMMDEIPLKDWSGLDCISL